MSNRPNVTVKVEWNDDGATSSSASEDRAADFRTLADLLVAAKAKGALFVKKATDEEAEKIDDALGITHLAYFKRGAHWYQRSIFYEQGLTHLGQDERSVAKPPADAIPIDDAIANPEQLYHASERTRTREKGDPRADAQHRGWSIYLDQDANGWKATAVDRRRSDIVITATKRTKATAIAAAKNAINGRVVVQARPRSIHDKNGRAKATVKNARAKTSTKEGPACAPQMKLVRADPDKWAKCQAHARKIGRITKPEHVYALIGAELERFDEEHFVIVPLDVHRNLRGGVIDLNMGQRSGVRIDVADVLSAVAIARCEHFIVAHNHPSGQAAPSEDDWDLTKKIDKAYKNISGVTFDDHVVVGMKQYYSLRDKRLFNAKPKGKR